MFLIVIFFFLFQLRRLPGPSRRTFTARHAGAQAVQDLCEGFVEENILVFSADIIN